MNAEQPNSIHLAAGDGLAVQAQGPSAPALPQCPYCGKLYETPVRASIHLREYDHVRRRQVAVTRPMEFCSNRCAGNYQMGCEG
jgi:hypothetical protein